MLIYTNLYNNFSTFFDKSSPLFISYPPDYNSAVISWINAIDMYASSVIPLSITSPMAKSSAIGILMGGIVPGMFITMLQQSIATYAKILATGMQPMFTGVPPIGIPILYPAFALGTAGGSAQQVMTMLCSIIHTYFKTGIAINNSSGITTIWI